MRSLAEQKGFTKFNAKKTARFIDKGTGHMYEFPEGYLRHSATSSRAGTLSKPQLCEAACSKDPSTLDPP